MKIKISILIALLISTIAYAQEPVRQKEVGLIFTSLDNFGVTFRTGKVNSLWRFNAANLSGLNGKTPADSITTKFSNGGFKFQVGKEFRKPISESLTFRYGVDISFNYTKNVNEYINNNNPNQGAYRKEVSYGPGVNLVIGANYKVSDHVFIGAELQPYLIYYKGESYTRTNLSVTENETSSFSYGFSTSSAAISLVVQF